jgi:PAS domain S-box-containing protein
MDQLEGSSRDSWLRAVGVILLPPALALAVFAAAVVTAIVPATERALLDRKRETLRAVVGAAHSLLARHAEAAQRDGDPAAARQRALQDLRTLRYGDSGKDYLWIMDGGLRMVMHPYRQDLEGQSVATFEDTQGKRVFAECKKLADAQGEGYVEYFWQWQDDPGRIEPKLSFIRAFAPWDWIVGTGLYLDDVRAELQRVDRRLYVTTGLVGAGMLLLLGFAARQGWRTEQRRRAAEHDLAASRERYRALAQASGDLAILFVGGSVAGANRTACAWLGIGEEELLGASVDSVLSPTDDADLVAAIRAGQSAPEREIRLIGHAGSMPVLVSSSRVQLAGVTAVLLAGRDLRPALGNGVEDAAAGLDAAGLGRLRFAADRSLTVLQASPLARWILAPGAAESGGTITLQGCLNEVETATLRHELATQRTLAGMLVRCRDGRALRLWTAPADVGPPATHEGFVAEATADVQRLDLAVQDPSGGISTHGGDLGVARLRLQEWAASVVRTGRSPEAVTGPVGRQLDQIVQAACRAALREVGPAPAPFALLALGSIGRGEPTLNPDQDTALLLADGDAGGAWPEAFGRTVTSILGAAGLPPCRAGHTAATPQWRLQLSQWRDRFTQWIQDGEPAALMQVNIFFDYRAVFGDETLADELRRHIFACVAQRPVFLRHLAADTMEFRSPLDALGRIRPDHPGEDHLDLKGVMMHIVNFARIYSLRHGIFATNTVSRLQALAAKSHLPADFVQDSLDVLAGLAQLRLQHQVGRLDRGLPIDNRLVLSTLSAWDRTLLKHALTQVSHLQQRLGNELLGG